MELVAARVNEYTEALFDLPQVLVKLSAKDGEVAGVVGFQHYLVLTRRLVAVQIGCRPQRGGSYKFKDNRDSAAVNCEFRGEHAAQGVGQGLLDDDLGEIADKVLVCAVKIDHAVVLRTALQLAGILL